MVEKEVKKQEEIRDEPAVPEEPVPEEPVPENDTASLIDELQDILAELTDIVAQLASQVKATSEIREGIAESLKGFKEEVIKEVREVVKESLAKPEDEDKKREAEWEKNPKSVKPSGVGEEVKVPESKVNEMQPGVQTLQEAMNVAKAERPVEVKKAVEEDDMANIIDAILKGEVKGTADLRRFRKV